MNLMKVVRINGYGAAHVIEQVPVPEISADEVLVRVKAASLNPLDLLLQSGKRREIFPLSFPYTLGTDLAGTVERAGPLAARWRRGDQVVARLAPGRGGALADFAVVPAASLAQAPAELPLDSLAGVPTAAGTAWQALFETGHLQAGQSVLVHAAAGGVGSFAIQLARIAGARVSATASGSGVELARQLGAAQVIDYRSDDFSEKLSEIDLVLDPVGGETQQRSFAVLRAGGTLVATASPPDEALAQRYKVTASRVFHQSDGSRLGLIMGLLNTGALKVLVDRQVTLPDLADAFQHLASGRARGKIIVCIS